MPYAQGVGRRDPNKNPVCKLMQTGFGVAGAAKSEEEGYQLGA